MIIYIVFCKFLWQFMDKLLVFNRNNKYIHNLIKHTSFRIFLLLLLILLLDVPKIVDWKNILEAWQKVQKFQLVQTAIIKLDDILNRFGKNANPSKFTPESKSNLK